MKKLTKEEIIKLSPSKYDEYKYPDVFKDSDGLDIVDKEKKLHAVKTWGREFKNLKRSATLKILTWAGICSDAEHVYGKIVIQGVEMEYDGKPGCTTYINSSNPLCDYKYELELKRYVTQEDKNKDLFARHEAEINWDNYSVGDLTNRFNTIKDLRDLAIEVFKFRFEGDWEFFIEFNGKTEKIIVKK